MRESRSALVAYYYLDFKDVAKRDVRGLLASILLQLVGNSDCCWDTLHQLYRSCCLGSEQPSNAALATCLVEMIDLPGQVPIYLILDALDECQNTTGTPSAREKVLNFVRDLLQSDHSNLFVCITSRPEQDISATLNPLTSPSNVCLSMKKAAKGRTSIVMSGLSFRRMPRCGDGEPKIRNM